MSSQFRRDNTNFRVALNMLEDIQKNGRPDQGLDRESFRLWICTLAGMGYIRKNAEGYVVTEKGREVLRRHTTHMIVSA
jgi:hypothetical protein